MNTLHGHIAVITGAGSEIGQMEPYAVAAAYGMLTLSIGDNHRGRRK